MIKTARLILAMALFVFATNLVFAQGISGAIWTTDSKGSVVNGNTYKNTSYVYLSGGGSVNNPCSQNGLPDGAYYFQVTNTAGSQLLSTTPIWDREVLVQNGIITMYTGTPGSHDDKAVPGNGKNAHPGSACGMIVVGLAPFAAYGGDECKVWLTPVEHYDMMGTAGFHGFLAKYSKTDNFKIKENGPPQDQCIISGYKFYDFNQNEVWDMTAEEVPIAGWRIEIFKNGILDGVTFTDDMGRYEFIRDLDFTTYEIEEVAPPPGFGVATLDAATGLQSGWIPTGPVIDTVVADAAQVVGPSFGNVTFSQALGAGRSKGFWHNQGEPQLLACDPTWRNELNAAYLRTNISVADPSLSIFTLDLNAPFSAAFYDFSNWIVGNPAYGHAAFQLSVQVAATTLNNSCGFMQGSIYVDRFQDGNLVLLDDLLAGAIGNLLSHPLAGLTGPNDGPAFVLAGTNYDPPYTLADYEWLRATIYACLNEFTAINNTGTLEEPQVVYSPDPDPKGYESPYER